MLNYGFQSKYEIIRLFSLATSRRRLLSIVKSQIDLSNAIRRGMRLEAENRLLRAEGVPALIAESPSMQPVLQMISRVGPSDANVLITGEPGTGKEVVAKTLFAISP